MPLTDEDPLELLHKRTLRRPYYPRKPKTAIRADGSGRPHSRVIIAHQRLKLAGVRYPISPNDVGLDREDFDLLEKL